MTLSQKTLCQMQHFVAPENDFRQNVLSVFGEKVFVKVLSLFQTDIMCAVSFLNTLYSSHSFY